MEHLNGDYYTIYTYPRFRPRILSSPYTKSFIESFVVGFVDDVSRESFIRKRQSIEPTNEPLISTTDTYFSLHTEKRDHF